MPRRSAPKLARVTTTADVLDTATEFWLLFGDTGLGPTSPALKQAVWERYRQQVIDTYQTQLPGARSACWWQMEGHEQPIGAGDWPELETLVAIGEVGPEEEQRAVKRIQAGKFDTPSLIN